MIEGLKVLLTTGELKELCLKQAAFHQGKANAYTKQLEHFEDITRAGEQEEGGSLSKLNPTQEARSRLKTHTHLAAEMRFIAEHLAPDELFQLERSDLVRIGVCGTDLLY